MYARNRRASHFSPSTRKRPALKQPPRAPRPESNPPASAIYSAQWVRASVSQLKFLVSRRSVDADMRPVIEFAIHRAPFGGAGSGDLFVTFGVERRRFVEMFQEGLRSRREDSQDARWLKQRLLEELLPAWRVDGAV